MLDVIAQIIIATCGVTAIGLTQTGVRKFMRFAPVFGLMSQPAWFYTTFTNEQWGIFTLSFFYWSMWAYGLYNFWFNEETKYVPDND